MTSFSYYSFQIFPYIITITTVIPMYTLKAIDPIYFLAFSCNLLLDCCMQFSKSLHTLIHKQMYLKLSVYLCNLASNSNHEVLLSSVWFKTNYPLPEITPSPPCKQLQTPVQSLQLTHFPFCLHLRDSTASCLYSIPIFFFCTKFLCNSNLLGRFPPKNCERLIFDPSNRAKPFHSVHCLILSLNNCSHSKIFFVRCCLSVWWIYWHYAYTWV